MGSIHGGELPDSIRRAIYGEMTLEEKRAAVDKSMNNWWREYAARKNDEEEEHVADTLLYDERCHLPRTAPRPDVVIGDGVVSYDSIACGSTTGASRSFPSFIESDFCTKVEYLAALNADFAVAEAAARAAYATIAERL